MGIRLRRSRTSAALASLLALLLISCERGEKPPPSPPPAVSLTAVDFHSLTGWAEDAVSEALPALRRSCARLGAVADGQPLGPDGLAGSAGDWREACAALAAAAPEDDAALRALIEANFVPYRVGDAGSSGLFTGYYEPELSGSRAPDARHRWPLYRPPDDLVTVDLGSFAEDLKGRRLVGRVADGRLVPYPARAEIDSGKLDGKALELLWLDDPVDVFFLHVQGSGRVRLPDGSFVRVGYAGSNGRDFTAIGKALLDDGKVPRDKVSMQAIRDWLRANPEDGRAYMERNARYIFFHEIEGDGPIGAEGVALTPGRSLAVDTDLLPLGAPLWLDTTWPGSDKPLRRLVVAQDTGSAIKGAVRGDLFWGAGEAALAYAGGMKQPGSYYLLLPKSVAERKAGTS
jgi:membrane-bound lytic murein transglycosylase A